ncbi:hypothetical protein PUN28_017266 [Cardiocondyla obscurior]|uniref:Uncharacterized protein n=1 Tax=Cardiocondyla obscurior TaxID=286306 RepID=A0AAW2EQV7_9HYME
MKVASFHDRATRGQSKIQNVPLTCIAKSGRDAARRNAHLPAPKSSRGAPCHDARIIYRREPIDRTRSKL